MAKFKFDGGILVLWVACAAFLGTGLGAGESRAAPQVLALIATGQPVALQCNAAECRAELPTLCLQPERAAPRVGRGYRLADGQSVVLSGRTADGAMVSIPLSREIRFAARRTHVTVEARIAREVIARLGLAEPVIQVGTAVTVIPVPAARDERPQTAYEIAAATGVRRSLAIALVDRDAERMPAVRLTNRLINALPADGKADPGLRRRLWTRVLDGARQGGISAGALERARFNVSHCTFNADNGLAPSLRRCLQGFNDDTMEYLNTDLESALKTGS